MKIIFSFIGIITLILIGGFIFKNQGSFEIPSIIYPQPSESKQVLNADLPWKNSICGNDKCEKCERKSDCCNYPPKKDKNGNWVYPPPTCIGWCEKDC